MRIPGVICFFLGFGLAFASAPASRAQGALMLQDANSLAEVFSPVGHESVYFARICAASLTKLRRCAPDELGVVIARYRGIAGYDWLAVPLLPYLYSVADAAAAPARIDYPTVHKLRLQYHDAHLMGLGNVPEGGQFQRGWNQLVGAAYDRRIYAFRFETTPEQDDAFIARMNDAANRSHFNFLFRNCANFSATVLDFYFPGGDFRHRPVSDGGLVTPREVAYKLVRYARKHPELHLAVLEIPLIPGFHHRSRVGMTAAGSLIARGYVVPIGLLDPYAGGVIVADFLVWGRDPLPVKQAEVLTPWTMALLKSGIEIAGRSWDVAGPMRGTSADDRRHRGERDSF